MSKDENALVDFEKAYWDQATKIFRESKGKDSKKLDKFLTGWETPNAVKLYCESKKAEATKEYASRFGRILEKIEIAMSVGDVAMKGAPESVGLAWMGIRFCLASVSDDYATFEIFGQACLDITGIVISCAVFAQVYGPSRDIGALDTKAISSQVTERIPQIYAEILDFSFEVKRYLGDNKGGTCLCQLCYE
jgi:hypothetical protein